MNTVATDTPEPEDRPGPVEQSVWSDIERVGKLDVGVRGSLKEMALKLARAFDNCQTDDITALAKLNAELRQTLGKLTDVGTNDASTIAGILRALSTPVRNGTDPGSADSGSEVCDGCGRPW